MIVVTLITIIVEATMYISDTGAKLDTIYTVNPHGWYNAIGFAIYSYEGIGVVLAVQDITKDQENYWKIVIAVIASEAFIYIGFA